MMPADLFTAYLWNVILNSCLAFVTLTLVVEGALALLRIKSERLKVICRCLPIFKLPFDLLLYDFSSWALIRGFNPLWGEPGSRMLTLEFVVSDTLQGLLPWSTRLQMSLANGWTFSLADLVLWSVHPLWLQACVAGVMCVALAWSTMRVRLFIRSWRHIRSVCNRAFPSVRPIFNLRLARALVYKRATVLVSDEIQMPFVTLACPNTIVLPRALLAEIDQLEYEAVLAHELEHLRWGDSWIRTFCWGVCAFFWWVPTAGLRRRLDASQEASCDQAARRYGMDGLVLASAITKALRLAKPWTGALAASGFVNPGQPKKRIEALLEPMLTSSRLGRLVRGSVVGVIMGALLFGKFWIF